MAGVEHAADVRVNDSVPLLDRRLSDGAGETDTSVVHEDVQTSKMLDGGLDSLLHLFGASHIGPNSEDGRGTTCVLQRCRAHLERSV